MQYIIEGMFLLPGTHIIAEHSPSTWRFRCQFCGAEEVIDVAVVKPADDHFHGISTIGGWEFGFGIITCPDCVETDEWCRLGQEWLDRWPEHLWQYNLPQFNRMDWHPPLALNLRRFERWTVMARSYRDACRQIQNHLDLTRGHSTYTVVYGIGEPEGYDTDIAIYFTEELM